jgi:hypothetical protein
MHMSHTFHNWTQRRASICMWLLLHSNGDGAEHVGLARCRWRGAWWRWGDGSARACPSLRAPMEGFSAVRGLRWLPGHVSMWQLERGGHGDDMASVAANPRPGHGNRRGTRGGVGGHDTMQGHQEVRCVVGSELCYRPWWSWRVAWPAARERASREWRGMKRVSGEVGITSSLPKHEMQQQHGHNNGGALKGLDS